MIKTASLVQAFPIFRPKTKIKVYGPAGRERTPSALRPKSSHARLVPQSARAKGFLGSFHAVRVYLGYALFAGILILFGVHLYSVNKTVSTGYALATLQTRLASLADENKRLMLKVSEVGSIATMQDSFARGRYVSVTSVEYVQAPSKQLTSK